MFYTKYRPQKFSEISKPNDVADAIATQVKNEKIAHAYLFVGPRGTGKTTTARILAKALNCEHLSKNGDPCDKCPSCIAIKNNSFFDLIEIDAASNRGIDDIRELKEKIKLAPSSGNKKVYIIDEVHMLTTEAFNALLKTLEEPPSHTIFILCTTELHKVPETIKSRCQLFKFKRATISQLTEKLKQIVVSEGANVTDEDLRQIANAVHGGFRDAETFLQQVIEGEIKTESLLNVGSISNIYDFVESLTAKDYKNAIRLVNKLYSDGIDLYVWTGELLKYLRSLMFISVDAHEGLLDVSEDILKDMKSQVKSMQTGQIINYLSAFDEASKGIKGTFITQLPLEITIVKLCDSGDDADRLAEPVSSGPKSTDKKTEKKTVDLPDIEKSISDAGLGTVTEKWEDIIRELSRINNTTAALLKVCKINDLTQNTLLLEVPFDFHKERIESSKNRA